MCAFCARDVAFYAHNCRFDDRVTCTRCCCCCCSLSLSLACASPLFFQFARQHPIMAAAKKKKKSRRAAAATTTKPTTRRCCYRRRRKRATRGSFRFESFAGFLRIRRRISSRFVAAGKRRCLAIQIITTIKRAPARRRRQKKRVQTAPFLFRASPSRTSCIPCLARIKSTD